MRYRISTASDEGLGSRASAAWSWRIASARCVRKLKSGLTQASKPPRLSTSNCARACSAAATWAACEPGTFSSHDCNGASSRGDAMWNAAKAWSTSSSLAWPAANRCSRSASSRSTSCHWPASRRRVDAGKSASGRALCSIQRRAATSPGKASSPAHGCTAAQRWPNAPSCSSRQAVDARNRWRRSSAETATRCQSARVAPTPNPSTCRLNGLAESASSHVTTTCARSGGARSNATSSQPSAAADVNAKAANAGAALRCVARPRRSAPALSSAAPTTAASSNGSVLSKLTCVTRRQEAPAPSSRQARANAGVGSDSSLPSGRDRLRGTASRTSGTPNRLAATAALPNHGENAAAAPRMTAVPCTIREAVETFIRSSLKRHGFAGFRSGRETRIWRASPGDGATRQVRLPLSAPHPLPPHRPAPSRRSPGRAAAAPACAPANRPSPPASAAGSW